MKAIKFLIQYGPEIIAHPIKAYRLWALGRKYSKAIRFMTESFGKLGTKEIISWIRGLGLPTTHENALISAHKAALKTAKKAALIDSLNRVISARTQKINGAIGKPGVT